jgi:hypothetical protein
MNKESQNNGNEQRGELVYEDEWAKKGKYRYPAMVNISIILMVLSIIFILFIFFLAPLFYLPDNIIFWSGLFFTMMIFVGFGLLIIGVSLRPIRIYAHGLNHPESGERHFILWADITRMEVIGEKNNAQYRLIKWSYMNKRFSKPFEDKCKLKIKDLDDAKKVIKILQDKLPDKIYLDSQPGFTSKVRII